MCIRDSYHIAVDRMFYSVPYQYIKNKVDVRITDTPVEIFYNHNRIASHRRLYGRSGQYSTVTEHMPQEHQKYLEWSGDRFRKWADTIGINTSKAVSYTHLDVYKRQPLSFRQSPKQFQNSHPLKLWRKSGSLISHS